MGALAAAWLVLTVLVAAAASAVAPLRVECGELDPTECRATVVASQARGLAQFHPLVLGASVSAGPAWPHAIGQRASVTFDLAGVPGPTTVRLFSDIGGHWGGMADRGTLELAAWSLAVAGLAATVVVVAVAWAIRRARRPA